MSSSSGTIILVLIAVAILEVGLVIVAWVSQDRSGERRVWGKQELERSTIECENLCSGLRVPDESYRLRTNITSKAESGVVTLDYEMKVGCVGVDKVLHEQFTALGLNRYTAEYTTTFLIFAKIETRYRNNRMKVDMSCTEATDILGGRQFTVSCSWPPG